MMKKLLLSLLIAGLVGSLSVTFAQVNNPQLMRGDSDVPANNFPTLQATHNSVNMAILIDEIEEAGFNLDTEEGFEEDWEEGIWISSNEDEVEALLIDPEDAELLDFEEVPHEDDIVEDWDESVWEDPEMALEVSDAFVQNRGEEDLDADLWDGYEGEDHDLDLTLADANFDESIWDEEQNWWEDDHGYDESWDEALEEWELEEIDSEDMEDIEFLEMMYEAG